MQNFHALINELSPRLYQKELVDITTDCPSGSGDWLDSNKEFKKWREMKDKSRRIFWLKGIPGAGKESSRCLTL
jgi:hypothetical protein